MKQERMQLLFHHLELPLVTPIKTAWGAFNKKPVIIVECTSEDVSGFGEVPCLPNDTYAGFSVEDVLTLIKRSSLNSINFEHSLSDTPCSNALTFGINAALHNYSLKIEESPSTTKNSKVSVVKVYGSSWSVSSIENDLVQKRYSTIKVKVTDPSTIKCLSLISHLDDKVQIIIDCNQCLTSAHDARFITELLPHCYLEEPFSDLRLYSADLERLIFDESATSIDAIQSLHQRFPAAHFSIKPFRFRNLATLKWFAHNALTFSLGGMYETGVGRHYNLFLAQLLDIQAACEISERNHYFLDEITFDNHVVSDGVMSTLSQCSLDLKNFEKHLLETFRP